MPMNKGICGKSVFAKMHRNLQTKRVCGMSVAQTSAFGCRFDYTSFTQLAD